MKTFTIEEIEKVVEQIKIEYNTYPTEDNEGDCLNASDGYELLLKKLFYS